MESHRSYDSKVISSSPLDLSLFRAGSWIVLFLSKGAIHEITPTNRKLDTAPIDFEARLASTLHTA